MLKRSWLSILLPFSACLSLAFCFVPAPTNISVTCHNFKNVVYWNYTKTHKQTVFIVEITPYSSVSQLTRTNETYLNVTEYTQEIDAYSVSVKAQLNGSENSLAASTEFTYNKDLPANSACVLDFPAINISALEHTITVSFQNPFDVYDIEPEDDYFWYTISYNETESTHDCFVEDQLCIVKIPLHESLRGRCVTLFFDGSINGASTKVQREVCGERMESSKTDWTVLSTVLLCTAFGLLMLIVAGVVVFKKLTQPSQRTILSKLLGIARTDLAINEPEKPALSEVTSVGHTPLLENMDLLEALPISKPDGEATHLPIHPTADIDVEEQENGDTTEDEDFGGTDSSGYDCRKFTMDMGQGDVVDAYGPR